MPDLAPSWIELSESALRKNLRFLRRCIGKGCRFISVVKGNAYGHGIPQFVPLAQRCGVRRFAVFSADEAQRVLRARTESCEVMIMGPISADALAWAVEQDVSFYVLDLPALETALKTARGLGRPARIHLELETGLNRTGLDPEQLERAVERVRDNPDLLRVEGVCTHFAGAESVSNYLRVQNQIAAFNEQWAWLQGRGIPLGLRHTACSAAVLTYPETIMDMVRVGISHYGFWPTQETRMSFVLHNRGETHKRFVDPLRRVMSWKSRVMHLKSVGPGQWVGYGQSYMTNRRQLIASVPVGYSHGFTRSLSNLGHTLVRGRRAPVVGLVNMNMMMLNVTDIPGVEVGDEVVLIGRQKKVQITVSSFADLTRNPNYEVLVRLPSELPRMVVD
jgi:alanine racemase